MIPFILSTLGSLCACLAAVPQIIRIIRLKCANALSYYFQALKTLAVVLFSIAVIITGNWLVALPNVCIIGCNSYLMWLKWHYASVSYRSRRSGKWVNR